VLRRNGGFRVALVDCSLQFGDIGALLNLAADRTIADLAANDAVADREVIQQVLIDGPEGIKVLLAPISPELADYVTTQHLRALMEELRRTFDFIIIDSTSYLNEISLDAIEMADQVLLITDMSVTAIKNTRLVLSVMEVLKVDRERFLVVANHRDGHSELERSYAENFLKNPVAVEIPYDPGVVATSISHGVPFVVSNPQSPATMQLETLASLIAPQMQPSAEPVAAGGGDDKKKKQRRLLGFARS
jgi:pilus assembly protein CpaE